uniref:Uncharacterized protein n=1 Tax=Anguilla anguilla TaxID=7936 RepID=A0A0E9U400_ANGAN
MLYFCSILHMSLHKTCGQTAFNTVVR